MLAARLCLGWASVFYSRQPMVALRILAMLAPLTLVGCAGARPISATPASIALRFDGGSWQLPEVTAQAQAHCARHSRDARLVSVSPEPFGVTTALFHCVGRAT